MFLSHLFSDLTWSAFPPFDCSCENRLRRFLRNTRRHKSWQWNAQITCPAKPLRTRPGQNLRNTWRYKSWYRALQTL